MKITKENALLPKEKAELKRIIKGLEFGKDLGKKDFSALFGCCYRMVLNKDEYFCTEGERCDTVAFIISGYLYEFYVNTDDEVNKGAGDDEIVTFLFFAPELRIVLDFESLQKEGVTKSTISSAGKSILICISIKDLEALYIKHPKLIKIERMLLIRSILEKDAAMEFLRRHDHSERLEALFKLYPKLYLEYTQKVIGSFLGVAAKKVGTFIKGISKIAKK